MGFKIQVGMGLVLMAALAPDAAQIVGGKSISITEAPWQLHMGGCGASWIGGTWVLTAAHCLDDNPAPSSVYVHAGITRTKEESNSTRTRASRIILHPDYRKSSCENCDIALVELVAPITRPLAKPIPLATPAHATAGLEKKGVACFATGWGFMDPNYTKTPDTLQGVHSKIYGADKTTINWAGNGTDTVGSCMGDSGGPLAIKDAAGQWILAGVSSTIPGGGDDLICGDPDGPPNYTRVSTYYPWIIGITGAFPTALNPSLAESRIAFPRDGQFHLSEARFLETTLLSLSGAKLSQGSGLYPAGLHAVPMTGFAPGKYLLRIRGTGMDVRRIVSNP